MKGDATNLSTDPDLLDRALASGAAEGQGKGGRASRGRPDAPFRPVGGGGQNLMRAPVPKMVMSSVGWSTISAL